MESAINYLKRINHIPDNVNMDYWIRAHNVPYLVVCSYCGMTVGIYEASADKRGFIFCNNCVFETDKSNPPALLMADQKHAIMEAANKFKRK